MYYIPIETNITVYIHVYLFERGKDVDDISRRRRVEPCEQVSECDLVLGHQVVDDHLPFPESLQLHGKEAWVEEEIESLLSPGLPCHLEPTQRGQQLHCVHVAGLEVRTGWMGKIEVVCTM